MVGLSTKRFVTELAGWDTVLGPTAYVPWIIALYRRSAATRAPGPALFLAVTVALSILAGHGMVPLFLCVVLPLACVAALGRRARRAALLRHGRTLASGLALGFALAAPLLLATLELSARSHRAHATPYGFPFHLRFLESLQALIVPDLSRRNGSWDLANGMGLAALPFACAALAGRRHGRVFPALLVLAFVFFSADETTVTGRLVERIPVLGQLGFRTRLLWISTIALAILAASGIDALLRRRQGRPIARLAAGFVVGTALTGLAYAPAMGVHAFGGFGAYAGPSWLVQAAGYVALVLLPPIALVRIGGRHRGAAAIALATVLELLWLSERALVRVPFEPIAAPSPIALALEKEEYPRLAVLTPRAWDDPVVPVYPSLVDRVGGYDPLCSLESARFLEAVEVTDPATLALARRGPPHRPWFELAGVARPDLLALGATHLVTRTPTDLALVASETRVVYGHRSNGIVEPAYLYRVDGALPRAYLMAHAEHVAAPDQLGAMLSSNRFEGRRRLLVEGAVPPELAGPSDALLPVAILEHHANRVVLRAEAPSSGGWVVLGEAWSPEWTATVDGAPAPIERANSLFRAVRIPGGGHTVEMRVHLSRGFDVGGAIAAAALAVLVAWSLAASRRRPGQSVAESAPIARPSQ